MMGEAPRVFISYSHDSKEHMNRVLELSNDLRKHGIDSHLDQYEVSPPEGWPKWMDRRMNETHFVLVVCTERYFARVRDAEEEGKGLGVRWESTLAYQDIYDAGSENVKFIPVLFDRADSRFIPRPLRGATRYCLDTEDGYWELYRRLTNQPRALKPDIGDIVTLPAMSCRDRVTDFPPPPVTGPVPPRVFLAKLPATGHELFGRETELRILDDAWADPHTRVLSLVAWGGVGKTTLVNHWLNRMGHDGFRGARSVYGCSFYSRGTREDRHASADEFLVHALDWFGDTAMANSKRPPWDKGVRLAELVRRQRTLLILDGLEPLQHPPGPMQGRLKDQGLQALLKELSAFNPGLCVVTTREEVGDIENAVGFSVKRLLLGSLPVEAGMELLRKLGVTGTDAELRKAVDDFSGHPLALSLLGTYLATVYKGDIRKRDLVQPLTVEEEQGGHARRVMESYEEWLRGKPELDILYLMGLFDRPTPGGAVRKLRAEPAIEGLTGGLQNLAEARWQYAVGHLRQLRLLRERDEDDPDKLDCHPLIREHFREKLRANNPEGWRKAHRRLYEYYKQLPKKHPDTLDEMEPLFAAVLHGCMAGRHEEVLSKVYLTRIHRGDRHYITRTLGAISADLAALGSFFETRWTRLVAPLSDKSRARILNHTGYDLRALGRLSEAAQCLEAALRIARKRNSRHRAGILAGHLARLHFLLGDLVQSEDYGRMGRDYIFRTKKRSDQSINLFTLADTLHQAGRPNEAKELFEQADRIQQEIEADGKSHESPRGFRYDCFLLERGHYKRVLKRARRRLRIVLPTHRLVRIAAERMMIGMALTLKNIKDGTGAFEDAADELDLAVAGMQKAGRQDDITSSLLARSQLYRVTNEFPKAWRDLGEACEIVTRCAMGLYLVNCCLEYAHLCLAQASASGTQFIVPAGRHERVAASSEEILSEAERHLEEAAGRVEKMGYHRRDAEVLLIRAELEFMEGNKAQAKTTLAAAKDRIKEMGCHRWDTEVRRLQRKFGQSGNSSQG